MLIPLDSGFGDIPICLVNLYTNSKVCCISFTNYSLKSLHWSFKILQEVDNWTS